MARGIPQKNIHWHCQAGTIFSFWLTLVLIFFPAIKNLFYVVFQDGYKVVVVYLNTNRHHGDALPVYLSRVFLRRKYLPTGRHTIANCKIGTYEH
jgi:hypothetical protein